MMRTTLFVGLTVAALAACERSIPPRPALEAKAPRLDAEPETLKADEIDRKEEAPPAAQVETVEEVSVEPTEPTKPSEPSAEETVADHPDSGEAELRLEAREDTCLGSACQDEKETALPAEPNRAGYAFMIKAKRAIASGKMSEALDDYLSACQLGHANGCHRYGWHLEQNGNIANAINFYRLACKSGVAKSCNNLGWLAEQRGYSSEAQDYYAWACLAQHPGSCANLRRVEVVVRALAH